MSLHENLKDTGRFLSRMSASIESKLRVMQYFPKNCATVLDVGCADGSVTITMARRLPHVEFVGIDLDAAFVALAEERAAEASVTNVTFRSVYLRDLLAEGQRFDAVTFISVLHEFYNYGEGMSSVMKAVADAHELLRSRGVLCIRDMMTHERMKEEKFAYWYGWSELYTKIMARWDERSEQDLIRGFESRFGLVSVHALNHLLLKLLYTDNWAHEMQENYLAVTIEDYIALVKILGMRLLHAEVSLLPYLRDRWQREYGLTEEELSTLYSTGLLIAKKQQ